MSPRFSIRSLSVQSDARLAELAGRGQERAFEALVRRYRRPLLGYCGRLGLSEQRAEDVLQQALTRAWLALGRGVEVRQPRAWLYRIVHNAAINAIRGSREHSEQSIEAILPGSEPSSPGDIEGGLRAREALGHVAALPEMQREVVVLTAIEGHSHEEAAFALGLSDGAVRGLLYRARTTLRSAAAALTPQGLLGWLTGSGADSSLAGRSVELSAGGAAVGAAGILAKGAAVTAVAGLLAAGGTVARLETSHKPHYRLRAGAAQTASSGLASSAVAAGPVHRTRERSLSLVSGPASRPRHGGHATRGAGGREDRSRGHDGGADGGLSPGATSVGGSKADSGGHAGTDGGSGGSKAGHKDDLAGSLAPKVSGSGDGSQPASGDGRQSSGSAGSGAGGSPQGELAVSGGDGHGGDSTVASVPEPVSAEPTDRRDRERG
jgi:RNA polymerase sigma factor (sigma-70 family)